MEAIALGIYVTKHTDQAAWTGTVAAAAFLPIAFFSPIGGALADRFPRRLLLIVTSLVQTGLAGLLTCLFIIGHPSAPTITLIALGNGVCAGARLPFVPGDAPRSRAGRGPAGRDRALVGAVQPRPRDRPRASRAS